MNKLIKIESLRGFASVYVALGHLCLQLSHVPKAVNYFFRFGQEAVIIFFLLSGIVIFYSYQRGRETPLNSYFIKRFRRIYFPFICSIIVSIIIANNHFSIKELIGNLLMLQDFARGKPGNIVDVFLGNFPLWSLSYEWVFYLMFPFVFQAIKGYASRVHYIGIFSLVNLVVYILFPNHIFLVLAYFFIWWTGLETGHYFLNGRDKTNLKILTFYYLVVIALLTINCFVYHKSIPVAEAGSYPYLILRHFGFAFICLTGVMYFNAVTQKLVGLLKPFSFIAPISYGIYILHYPILIQAHFGLSAYVELPVKIILLISLAWLIEVILQPTVNKYVR